MFATFIVYDRNGKEVTEHLDGYDTLEEAIEKTLETWLEDTQPVLCYVKDDTGRYVATLMPGHEPEQAFVTVMNEWGRTELRRYHVEYETDTEGNYQRTKITLLGA